MEGKQLLRDPGAAPTAENIAAALGEANAAYVKFTTEAARHGVEIDWRYYNDGKAWLGKSLYKWTTSRGTAKELTAFWLSIWAGYFRVGFMLPVKYRDELLTLPLSDGVKETIAAAQQVGKLKTMSFGFDVCAEGPIADIFTLVEFKKAKK